MSKGSVGISDALTLMLLSIQTKIQKGNFNKKKTLLIIKLPMLDLPMSRCDKSGKGKTKKREARARGADRGRNEIVMRWACEGHYFSLSFSHPLL